MPYPNAPNMAGQPGFQAAPQDNSRPQSSGLSAFGGNMMGKFQNAFQKVGQSLSHPPATFAGLTGQQRDTMVADRKRYGLGNTPEMDSYYGVDPNSYKPQGYNSMSQHNKNEYDRFMSGYRPDFDGDINRAAEYEHQYDYLGPAPQRLPQTLQEKMNMPQTAGQAAFAPNTNAGRPAPTPAGYRRKADGSFVLKGPAPTPVNYDRAGRAVAPKAPAKQYSQQEILDASDANRNMSGG